MLLSQILIVDDNAAIRRSLRTVLESVPDFTICGEAENGKDGVELAERVHPDAIVLDLSMPVMNGLEATRRLKQLMPVVPIIRFTSFSEVGNEASKAGANKVLSKSGPPSELIQSLKTLLQKAA